MSTYCEQLPANHPMRISCPTVANLLDAHFMGEPYATDVSDVFSPLQNIAQVQLDSIYGQPVPVPTPEQVTGAIRAYQMAELRQRSRLTLLDRLNLVCESMDGLDASTLSEEDLLACRRRLAAIALAGSKLGIR